MACSSLACIRQGARHHEAALDEHILVDSLLAQLVPELAHFLDTPHRTFAVRNDRMLIETARHLVHPPQLRSRLAPAIEPVESEPVELACSG